MPKILIAVFLVITLYFICPIRCFAKSQDSFELFWPVTAGKTADELGYNLKRWKENLRGMLILGNLQKADYEIELGTKRLLEAEKLLENGKKDLAQANIDEADLEFISARRNLKIAMSRGERTKIFSEDNKSRIEKILVLLQIIANKNASAYNIDKINESVQLLFQEIK